MDTLLTALKFSETELMALAGIFLMGWVGTEFVKRIVRHMLHKKLVQVWRSDLVWAVSIAASMCAAASAWPASALLPWWIVGAGAGALNSVAVKIVAAALYKVSPTAAAAFTGNRRKCEGVGPGGLERRGTAL